MELDEWLSKVVDELKLRDITIDDDAVHTVLDLARDAAHQVERPAAPLTTFLVGVAVGQGATLGAAAAAATNLALNADALNADAPTDET